MNLAEVQRDFIELYRTHILGIPHPVQAITDFANAAVLEDVDKSLGWVYNVCQTRYHSEKARRQGENFTEMPIESIRFEMELSFPDVLSELETLVNSNQIPSLEFGFIDVVGRGLDGRPLTDEYHGRQAIQNLYERSQRTASELSSKGISLHKHVKLPQKNFRFY